MAAQCTRYCEQDIYNLAKHYLYTLTCYVDSAAYSTKRSNRKLAQN